MPPRTVELGTVRVPDFASPGDEPGIEPEEYQGRIGRAQIEGRSRDLDFLLVYGDREHFANITFLVGFDPRFEEALLVIPNSGGQPLLIIGSEGVGYSEIVAAGVERKLFQGFSLLGTDRSVSPRLEPILRQCGIREGSRIGVVGWKYVTDMESDDPPHWIEIPAFIVDSVRSIVRDRDLVTNATSIFMNPSTGLRSSNSVDQIAAFEFAASHCSEAVHRAVANVRPGVSELEVVERMELNGLPLSCHLMFSTGPRSYFGLSSPTTRQVCLGDPFFVAMGLRGGLTARAGFVAKDDSDLAPESADYLECLVKPYYATVVAWYETIGIGIRGDELQQAVDGALAGHSIDLALNPGHLIHLDEWMHSPVYPGSDLPFLSSMMVQCDIIPVVEPRYHTSNAEDTLVLADEALRQRLRHRYPLLWERIQTRRTFMTDVLGIALKPEVLPLSNRPALLQPFALAPELAMKVAA